MDVKWSNDLLSESAQSHVDVSVAFLLTSRAFSFLLRVRIRALTCFIRPPEEFIPPADQPYQYIIFRASEVKDIALDGDQPPMVRTRSVTDDPAVMSVSTALNIKTK